MKLLNKIKELITIYKKNLCFCIQKMDLGCKKYQKPTNTELKYKIDGQINFILNPLIWNNYGYSMHKKWIKSA